MAIRVLPEKNLGAETRAAEAPDSPSDEQVGEGRLDVITPKMADRFVKISMILLFKQNGSKVSNVDLAKIISYVFGLMSPGSMTLGYAVQRAGGMPGSERYGISAIMRYLVLGTRPSDLSEYENLVHSFVSFMLALRTVIQSLSESDKYTQLDIFNSHISFFTLLADMLGIEREDVGLEGLEA